MVLYYCVLNRIFKTIFWLLLYYKLLYYYNTVYNFKFNFKLKNCRSYIYIHIHTHTHTHSNLVLHIILLFCWAISYDNCCILHVLRIPLIFNRTISIHTDLWNETIKQNWIWFIFLEFQEFHSCAHSTSIASNKCNSYLFFFKSLKI